MSSPNRYDSAEFRNKGLAPVLIRFGSWAVTTYGVERIDGSYPIAINELRLDWQWLIEQERQNHFDGPGDHMGLIACLEYARTHYRIN